MEAEITPVTAQETSAVLAEAPEKPSGPAVLPCLPSGSGLSSSESSPP